MTQAVCFQWMNCVVYELHLSRAIHSNTPRQLHTVTVEELRCFLLGRKVHSKGMSVQGCGCCRVLAWERHGVYGNQVEFWSLNWPWKISKGRILVKTETTSVKLDFGKKGWGCFIRVKSFFKPVTECVLLTLGPRTLEPPAWVRAWFCTCRCICSAGSLCLCFFYCEVGLQIVSTFFSEWAKGLKSGSGALKQLLGR